MSPDEVIGEEERDRLETQWNSRFRRGGRGKVVVAESALRVQLLAHSMGDLAALADMKATKEDICNAFHVPISFLTSETNLANLQAAEHQHMAKAMTPRLQRRDEKLNEQLVPLFDPTGRLFLASEDPVPVNRELTAKEQDLNLKYGVATINEVRGDRGCRRCRGATRRGCRGSGRRRTTRIGRTRRRNDKRFHHRVTENTEKDKTRTVGTARLGTISFVFICVLCDSVVKSFFHEL